LTFSADISKFIKSAEKKLRDAVVNGVFRLSTKIVQTTPVDAPYGWHDPESIGEARGGWFISFDGPSSQATNRLDPSGEVTLAKIKSQLRGYRIRTHNSIHLNNNVPYIGVLEYGGYNFLTPLKSTADGYSTQAPHGMARLAALQWPTFVEAKATSRMS
jgi:hypothetical protein